MKHVAAQAVQETLQFLRKHISWKNEELPFYILILVSFVIFIAGINFFIELTEEIPDQGLKSFDQQITDCVLSFRNPELTQFFTIVTDMGGFYGYLIATTLVAIFFFFKFRHWEFTLQLMAVVILAALSNIALKKFIDRARPGIEHLVVVESLSYPSGHAMSAMAFYGFLIYLLFHIKMGKLLRSILATLFVFLILSIGISRIYLGVHYPSDVLGGFVAGLIWVAFCIILFTVIAIYRTRMAKRDFSEKEENLKP